MNNDVSKTISPKSSQLNADDFIGHDGMTITVTKVSLLGGDQPVAINFEGDNGLPFLPCKGMRRLLVSVWGGDGNLYIGRSMRLYRDEKVRFGGAEVGGIRISHLSHIAEPVTIALTVSRANRKPYVVKPLVLAKPAAQEASKPAQSSPETPPIDGQEAQATLVTPDQCTALDDELNNASIRTNRTGEKRAFLAKYGIDSLSRLPASKYQEALAAIQARTK